MSVVKIFKYETDVRIVEKYTYLTCSVPVYYMIPTVYEKHMYTYYKNSIMRLYLYNLRNFKMLHDDILLHSSGIIMTGGEIAIQRILNSKKQRNNRGIQKKKGDSKIFTLK